MKYKWSSADMWLIDYWHCRECHVTHAMSRFDEQPAIDHVQEMGHTVSVVHTSSREIYPVSVEAEL